MYFLPAWYYCVLQSIYPGHHGDNIACNQTKNTILAQFHSNCVTILPLLSMMTKKTPSETNALFWFPKGTEVFSKQRKINGTKRKSSINVTNTKKSTEQIKNLQKNYNYKKLTDQIENLQQMLQIQKNHHFNCSLSLWCALDS